MCGIAATFAYGSNAPPVDRDELIAIRDHMLSRGPDGEGEWFSPDGRVGFGHRRFSIIDLSPAGAQPMWNAGGTLGIIFNGEIYNYQALRSELQARGHVFRTQSDTEVLLHLYDQKGAAMTNELRGMYAFVIWDARRRTLFAARDPFGIKPLYYNDDGQTIRIASQVKALLRSKHVNTDPDPAGHVGFFLWGSVPGPHTLYRGIRALPAGHTLFISENGRIDIRPWCLVADLLSPADGAKGEARITRTELREAMADSIEHHLVADVPVGVFLSSGLDSTTIAAFASARHKNLKTVTLGFNEYRGTPNDETPQAEETARRLGTEHRTIWVSRDDFESESEKLFAAMDQPSIDGVNTYFVSLAAKRAGLKVAMSGLGGDELFASYPSFRQVPRAARLLRPFGPVPFVGRWIRKMIAPWLRHLTSTKYAGIFEYGSTLGGAYLLRRGLFLRWELPEVLSEEMVREGWEELDTLGALQKTAAAVRANARAKVSALEMCFYMRNQLLRDADWAGMAHSVEIRVPFVDVQLTRRLAPFIDSSRPPSKKDMALSALSDLPAALLDRPKTGFVVPVRDWLKEGSARSKGSVDQANSFRRFDSERGLRGWAREVYAKYTGTVSSHAAPAGSSLVSTISRQRRVLVYRIGQLGDTIVALPAMRAVRNHFPDAHIELLCDRHEHTNYVLAADILAPTGLFDDFITYDVRSRRPYFGELAPLLRSKRFDTIVYLAPSQRTKRQIVRDRLFFRLVGIKHFFGFRNFPNLPPKRFGQPLPTVAPEGDLLLDRLAADGIRVPDAAHRDLDLCLMRRDEDNFERWLAEQSGDGGRRWFGVGPGCKQPVNRWPLENFVATLTSLIERFDVWPIVFGGAEDVATANALIAAVGRGFNAAGRLDVRASAVAMRKCALFLGNDTGTMHIAASAGIPCVGIYSARQWRGLWEPYTPARRILRSQIECEGCGLSDCVVLNRECLRRITPAMAIEACAEFLSTPRPSNATAPSLPVLAT